MTYISARLFFLSLALFVGSGEAATLRVPAPYPTIQSAVNAAQPNDTVLVGPGTYFEHVFITRSLKLVSTHGATRTTIDASYHGPAVKILGTGVERVAVSGFTLTHGQYIFPVTPEEPDPAGAGIYATAVDIDLNHNIVEENLACSAAILIFFSRVKITDNVVRNNSGPEVCRFRGLGILVGGSTDLLSEAVIERNDIYGHAGGGLFLADLTKLSLRNNHIHHNINPPDVNGGSAIAVENILH
jgi:hypothetical protein